MCKGREEGNCARKGSHIGAKAWPPLLREREELTRWRAVKTEQKGLWGGLRGVRCSGGKGCLKSHGEVVPRRPGERLNATDAKGTRGPDT